ncbi:prepilin-type N-terminal cleavage/methylation domain-containing protein [Bacillus luteolus]|uniref:Prepilin-type N-terminal cleavage/methylation domain-containing protein n=1 Tax=Litchfieldia luteola TaxID=682179 RepID=A0ABR9QHJ2_9BACI|nr:competence type IV pilus minor pilin ComGF [Cytobacillus luteolus]MBE4907948.1 prepilin-type N-terminal cleavage/methylation domain-containing protein [Cytobacillus luteolus]MBP1942727.1 competence protein ComGF [Cytobacillus luteolus]
MNNERGFTFLEMLVSLSILMLILTFVVGLLAIIKEPKSGGINKLEWEVFIQQAKQEIYQSTHVTKNITTLRFSKNNGETVTYETYGTSIRRRVNGAGHEILLQNVNGVKYEMLINGVVIEAIDKHNNVFKSQLFSVFPLG